MNFLFFLLAIVLIYKVLVRIQEGFDGNCFKRVIPDFRKSDLTLSTIKEKYQENGNADISEFLRDAEIMDFSTNIINQDISGIFGSLEDISGTYLDKTACKLDYLIG